MIEYASPDACTHAFHFGILALSPIAMKAASAHEIKKELGSLDRPALVEYCLRLAKFKKENKELLTYLIYEAQDESAYVINVKADLDDEFSRLSSENLYYLKKSLRRILRIVNKQIRYSGVGKTELELRIHFCRSIKNLGIHLEKSSVLHNLYLQQIKKINAALAKLDEDLQFDYQSDIERLS